MLYFSKQGIGLQNTLKYDLIAFSVQCQCQFMLMMAAPRLLLLIVVLHLQSLHTRYLLVQTDGEDGSASSKTNMRNNALSKDCDLCCAPDGGTQGCTFICCEDVKTDDFPIFQPPINGPRENRSGVLYFN